MGGTVEHRAANRSVADRLSTPVRAGDDYPVPIDVRVAGVLGGGASVQTRSIWAVSLPVGTRNLPIGKQPPLLADAKRRRAAPCRCRPGHRVVQRSRSRELRGATAVWHLSQRAQRDRRLGSGDLAIYANSLGLGRRDLGGNDLRIDLAGQA